MDAKKLALIALAAAILFLLLLVWLVPLFLRIFGITLGVFCLYVGIRFLIGPRIPLQGDDG